MTNDGGEYDISPDPPKPPRPKPGDPDWVEPVPVIEKADPVKDEPEAVPVDPDVEKHKGIAILSYIIFIIPLIAAPHSKFARYHANQGLLLFILWCASILLIVALQVGLLIIDKLLDSVPVLLIFFSCVFHVLQPAMIVGLLILMVMGIIHAANGEKKPLPMIGHWTLIK